MIDFNQVSKHYPGPVSALKDISLHIDKGELVFLAGPSGAGKSTLLRLMAAITRPSSGSLTINGQNVGQIKRSGIPYLRRNLGLILQDQRLLDDRSVRHNVMLPLLVCGASPKEARARADLALDKIGMLEHAGHNPKALSGGEQQRVAIARAIVNRPQIILADEPTANLDRDNANLVLDALRIFHAAGVTCLISTHDELFLNNANRVIFLEQGHLVDNWHTRVLHQSGSNPSAEQSNRGPQ